MKFQKIICIVATILLLVGCGGNVLTDQQRTKQIISEMETSIDKLDGVHTATISIMPSKFKEDVENITAEITTEKDEILTSDEKRLIIRLIQSYYEYRVHVTVIEKPWEETSSAEPAPSVP